MPDHLHLLIEGQSEDADFLRTMRVLRQRLSVVHGDMSSGPLWQDGYYERVLRDEEATPSIANYIVANPLRAGLVANALDYPFNWSMEWDEESSADHSSVRPTY